MPLRKLDLDRLRALGEVRRAGTAPDLDLLALAHRRGRQPERHRPGASNDGLGCACVGHQAAGEAAAGRVDQQVLVEARDPALLVADVVGLVEPQGLVGQAGADRVRRLGPVRVLGAPDVVVLARAVDPVEAIEHALEPRDHGEVGEVRVAATAAVQVGRHVRSHRLGLRRVRVVGEPAGAEQRRVLLAEAPRAGRRRRAAAGAGRRAAELAVARVHAVQRAQEPQRLDALEAADVAIDAAGRDLADQDRVPAGLVAALGQAAPGVPEQPAVDRRPVSIEPLPVVCGARSKP